MSQNRFFALTLAAGDVHIDNEQDLINLTEIFNAAGSPANQGPAQWKRLPSTEALLIAAQQKLNVELSHILITKRGGRGGTWAHPTVALAYAGYLDAGIQIEMSEAYRRYLSADAEMAVEIAERNLSDEQKIWLGARLLSKQNEQSFRKVVSTLGGKGEDFRLARHALRRGLFQTQNLRLVTNTQKDEIIKDHLGYGQNLLEALAMQRLETLIEYPQNIKRLDIKKQGISTVCAAFEAIGSQVRMGAVGVPMKTQIPSISQMFNRNLKSYQINAL